jgi:UDP-N-acetyl-2-amino-2-deoxyglucuronate dehydrogenase
MIKVGLIGCGMVARIHMKAYKAMSNVQVVALSDMDTNRAKAFAESCGIDKIFSSSFDLFALKDLDFVDVCTPTSTHESVVRDAAKSGVNVLMEKPMARNSEECDRMIEEAKKHNTQLCVCHNQLFFPHVQYLKSVAFSEGFNLTSFRTSHRENFEWLKAHNLAQPWNVHPEHGGILWEVGTHLAYLQLHFLKDINEVYAIGAKEKYSVWDDFIVLLRTSTQRWGIMEINWVAKEAEIFYEIIGSAGQRLQTYLPHGYIIERMKDSQSDLGSVLSNYFSDQARLYKKWSKFAIHQIRRPTSGHFKLISSYAESIQKGLPPPVTGEDGRNAIKLLECIEKSLSEKRSVEYSVR